MGSPLGDAKYNSLLQGAASLDTLGTTDLDVPRNTYDYTPRVEPGRIRGRPCFEHGDVEEWGRDAITMKGAQNQPWPCGGTAGSVRGEFH